MKNIGRGNDGGLKCRMIAVSIIVMMCLSAFGIVTPTVVVAAENSNNVDDNGSLTLTEDVQDFNEIEGPWLCGNITAEFGEVPQPLALMFFNRRTGENVVEIVNNVTYAFSLQNFLMGYEVGDQIFIEALVKTGNGKINIGDMPIVITDAEIIWADLLLLTPPATPPPMPHIEEYDFNEVEEDSEDPIEIILAEPGTRTPLITYNVTLVNINSPTGILYVGKRAPLQFILKNEGPITMKATTEVSVLQPDGSEIFLGTLNYNIPSGKEMLRTLTWMPEEGKENIIIVTIYYEENGDAISHTRQVGFWVIPEDEEVIKITPGMTELPEHHGTTYIIQNDNLIIGSNGIPHFPLDADTIIMENLNGTDGEFQILIESDGVLEAFANSNIRASNNQVKYRFNVYGTLIVDYSTVKWMWGDNDLSLAGGIIIHPGATVEIRNGATVSEGKTHNIWCTDGSSPIIRDSIISMAGTSGGHGIVIQSDTTPTIDGNTFTDNMDYGILVNSNTNSISISNNVFTGGYDAGTGIFRGYTGITLTNSNSILSGNTIDGCAVGILAQSSSTPTIESCNIINSVDDPTTTGFPEGIGIYVSGSSPSVTTNIIDSNRIGIFAINTYSDGYYISSNPSIINNPSISLNTYGIYLRGYYSASIRGTIQNNPIMHDNQYGIVAFYAFNLQITGNVLDSSIDGIRLTYSNTNIDGNIIESNGYGIYFNDVETYLRSKTVVNNLIRYNPTGIYISKNQADLIIESNSIIGIEDKTQIGITSQGSKFIIRNNNQIQYCLIGVQLSASKGSSISGNTIEHNNVGIYFYDSSATVDGNNIIRDNQNGIYSQFCRGTDVPVITGNTITGNENGVVSRDSEDVIYNNIQISENTYGIVSTENSAPTIKDNHAIYNNIYGIYTIESTPTIDGNVIVGNGIGEYGISSTGISSYPHILDICHNTINSHSKYGIYIHQTPVSIDTNDITNNNIGIHMDDVTDSSYDYISEVNVFSDESATKLIEFDSVGNPLVPAPTFTLPNTAHILSAEATLTGQSTMETITTQHLNDFTVGMGGVESSMVHVVENNLVLDQYNTEDIVEQHQLSYNTFDFVDDLQPHHIQSFTPQSPLLSRIDIYVDIWSESVPSLQIKENTDLWTGTIAVPTSTVIPPLNTQGWASFYFDPPVPLSVGTEYYIFVNWDTGLGYDIGYSNVDLYSGGHRYIWMRAPFELELRSNPEEDLAFITYAPDMHYFDAGYFVEHINTEDPITNVVLDVAQTASATGSITISVSSDGSTGSYTTIGTGDLHSVDITPLCGSNDVWVRFDLNTNDAYATPELHSYSINIEETHINFPNDPSMYVGLDDVMGCLIWSDFGTLDHSVTVSDVNTAPSFKRAIQDYINGNIQDSIDIPLALYSSSAGYILMSNLRIRYLNALTGSIIKSNYIASNDRVGIELLGSSSVILENQIETNCVGIGIYDLSSPLVIDNEIMLPPYYMLGMCGIDVRNSIDSSIIMNTIVGYEEGIEMYCIYSDDISINDNIFRNARGALYVYGSQSATIHQNIFESGKSAIWVSDSNVDVTDNSITTEHGIFAYRTDARIIGNSIMVTGDINPETGIMTGGGPVIISENIITGSGRGRGVFVGNIKYPYANAVVSYNTITGFDHGIDLRASSTSIIDHNIIYENDYDGIFTGGGLVRYGSKPVYTITNCEIFDNGNWGMNFISNAPTNADTLEADNPLLGNNGLGKIHQEWKITGLTGKVRPYTCTPMHVKITELDGETVIFEGDIPSPSPYSSWNPVSIPTIEYELLNTGSTYEERVWHSPITIEAESYGEYYSPPKTQIEHMDCDKNVWVMFDIVEDTYTFLMSHPVPGYSAKNYMSFPLMESKVDGRLLQTVEDLWDEIDIAGGIPQEIRMWEPGIGWLSYVPGDPVFDIRPDYAYEITCLQPFGLAVTGYLPGYRYMDLQAGTNYIGWITHHTEIKVSTFETLLTPQNLDTVYRWSTVEQMWISMSPSDFLYPGRVYMVVTSDDCALAYNEAGLVDEVP